MEHLIGECGYLVDDCINPSGAEMDTFDDVLTAEPAVGWASAGGLNGGAAIGAQADSSWCWYLITYGQAICLIVGFQGTLLEVLE